MIKKLFSNLVFIVGGSLIGILSVFLTIIYIAIYVIWKLTDYLLGRLT